MTKTVYIAGLGLIGGSLALGIRKHHPDYTILGYNRGEKSRSKPPIRPIFVVKRAPATSSYMSYIFSLHCQI
jgi:prephenate dehydrogenase